MTLKKIRDLCHQYFHFLETEGGMTRVQDEEESWGCRVIYQGTVTGVTVEFEKREHYPFVTLHRLVDGGIEHIGEIDDTTVLNSFDLDDVVIVSGGTPPEPDGQSVEGLLAAQAERLKTFGAKILKGDFQQFPALDARVKARARLYKG